MRDVPILRTSAGLPVPHDDGTWHSAEVSRIVECIREYDHRLNVRYIPEALREPGDAAYAITEHTADGQEVVAFYVNTEEEMNLSVLERIYAGDNAKHNVELALDAKREAQKALRRKRYEDEMAEAHEKAHWLGNVKKHTVNMGNGRTINLR